MPCDQKSHEPGSKLKDLMVGLKRKGAFKKKKGK